MIIISFMPFSEFAFERIGRMMAEKGKNACAVGMNPKRPIFLCGTGINKKQNGHYRHAHSTTIYCVRKYFYIQYLYYFCISAIFLSNIAAASATKRVQGRTP